MTITEYDRVRPSWPNSPNGPNTAPVSCGELYHIDMQLAVTSDAATSHPADMTSRATPVSRRSADQDCQDKSVAPEQYP